MLEIKNDGAAIVSTTYWQSEYARRGYLYVSVNAGTCRVLLPPALISALPDMRTAKIVIVSRGPWPQQGLAEAFELLFDDGSDSPYALHLSPQQIDRVPPDSESGREVRVTVWTEGPQCVLDLPGRYRRSARIPDLSPWRVN